MRCAEFCPQFTNDNIRLDNDWPVSVLTTFAEMYESLLNDQVKEYFYKLVYAFYFPFLEKV